MEDDLKNIVSKTILSNKIKIVSLRTVVKTQYKRVDFHYKIECENSSAKRNLALARICKPLEHTLGSKLVYVDIVPIKFKKDEMPSTILSVSVMTS